MQTLAPVDLFSCASTYCSNLQRWRRGHNLRGQGPSCRGQVASRPRTERLEAKFLNF